MRTPHLFSALFSLISLLSFTGCSGGGGEYAGPALVNVDANPSAIDGGDRTTVTIRIQQVNEDGIMLKIRVPKGLDYVIDSGNLTVHGITINLDPDANKSDTTHNYLVYFLSRGLFGHDNEGAVTVQFEGTAAVETGAIEVDPDIDNLTIANSVEFDVTTPKFSAEDSQSIIVTN